MLNELAGRGSGIFRQPFKIREFLAKQGKNMSDVAREVGVLPQIVQQTVRGVRNHRGVLQHLLNMGCPEEYLSMPKQKEKE